ncbi:MAG: hypothetical protein QNI96_05155 [Woeseiaceae bacterium]|nr:hypothetical protein [Woeseiaceae bacterium]
MNMNIYEFYDLFAKYNSECDELGVSEDERYNMHEFLNECVRHPEVVAEIQNGTVSFHK